MSNAFVTTCLRKHRIPALSLELGGYFPAYEFGFYHKKGPFKRPQYADPRMCVFVSQSQPSKKLQHTDTFSLLKT